MNVLRPALTAFATPCAIAVALLVTGCGGDDCADRPGCSSGGAPIPAPRPACIDEATPADSPSLIVGIGQTPETFAPLGDGSVVQRVNGPQGGQHIDVAARVHADRVVEVRFGLASEGLLTVVEAEPCDNGWVQVVGRIFDPPAGSPTVEVEVVDGSTVLVSDSVTITVP